jgi:hypothetical protein
VFGFNFVYSGNFTALAEVTQHKKTRFVMGINDADFSWLLEPGESFIYHYYKEVDKEYTYLKNLIEDAGSNGAKVTVNPYPISHFTDEYTEKYPPENKDFVFYVKHKNGELY